MVSPPSNHVWDASTHSSNTTMCAILNFPWARLTDFSQQSKDVSDKLDELIPWLTKLREGLAKVDANEGQQEVERRTQLARLTSNRRPDLAPKD